MFNLSKRERFIILFLVASLAAGSAIAFYQKSNSIIDVKIRSFDHEGLSSGVKKININDADETALMRLPGVGKALAGRIAEYRIRQGSFRYIEEIKKVKGVKENLFVKIKDNITVE